jgi:hypothetical protein
MRLPAPRFWQYGWSIVDSYRLPCGWRHATPQERGAAIVYTVDVPPTWEALVEAGRKLRRVCHDLNANHRKIR